MRVSVYRKLTDLQDMLPRLLTSIALAATLTPSAHAVSTQATEPVGFMRYQASPGLQTIGFPLMNAAVFSGEVTSVGADHLEVASGSRMPAVGARLDAKAAYYLEFTAGFEGDATFVGERLELDVARTRDAANPSTSVRLLPGNARSTLHVLPTTLAGYRFVIRPHVTLASAFGTGGTCPLRAGRTTANGDQVNLLQNGSFQTYLFQADARTGAGHWVKFPEATPADNLPVAPGTGLFLRRVAGGTVTFTHLGAVRTHAFMQPLEAGYTLASEGFPVASSFATRAMTEANGFAAGANASAADRVYEWTGSTYRTLFFAAISGAKPDWRPADATAQDVNGEEESPFSPFGAVLIDKLAADPAYVVPAPL